jgi:Dolichyl-phosphate-mannose-protein mannosyltransferase
VIPAWQRLLAFVPTRAAAIALFLLALAAFWLEALGWPMAKGRDTWDYLVYYLQLFDSDPPFSELQVFRTPITPLVLGVPLELGGTALLEVVFGLLYAISIVAWSATALVFGRIPALFAALLLLVYPAYATLYHQASSDAVFATGLACWALLLARTLDRPSGWGFVALGAGIAVLVLVRAANQVLLPLALVPLLAPWPWRRRVVWSAACLAAAVLPLAAWAAHNGARYDSATVQRGGRAWVPFLRVFTTDATISPENGPASRRLGTLIEENVLAREPHAGLRVPLDAYLEHGSNYETVRLIALSDRVLGRDENYGVLFDSAVEAIREHPGTYVRGVADTFWEFLLQAPLREDVVPREQTAPEPPAPTFERDGVVLPNPQAHVLVEAVRYGFVWCASDYIDSCTVESPSLVWDDAATRERYREVVAQVRDWDAELPSREGVSVVPELLNRITPRFPRPPLWLAVGVVALAVRRPRGTATILVLWLASALVLLVHAISQGVAPEFALPVYPVFLVGALAALAGERGPRSEPAAARRPDS